MYCSISHIYWLTAFIKITECNVIQRRTEPLGHIIGNNRSEKLGPVGCQNVILLCKNNQVLLGYNNQVQNILKINTFIYYTT